MPKFGRCESLTGIVTPNAKTRTGKSDLEDLCRVGKWLALDGTVFTVEATDDGVLPGGPRQGARTFEVPFARASGEDDYRVAWAFFEQQGGAQG